MKNKETTVATLPTAELVDESELTKEVTDIEFQAESLVIETDQDYEQAAEFGKMLKQKASEVTAFFKPMKDSAYQAHKAVCDREKTMLVPLKNAESIVKKGMGTYLVEQDRKRREAEEAARRAAQAERDRLMAQAEKMEASGDNTGAEAAVEEAVVMDEAMSYTAAAPAKPKVSGVSTSKDWEIAEIDPAKVPVNFAGMEIRPVDKAAIMRLIRASKGSIQIPGVAYKEIAKMSFRR